VDATRLDELAQRLVSAERRARDESVDLDVAASAAVAGLLGSCQRSVGWALRLRDGALQAVLSLAAVVMVVARSYRATERTILREIARSLPELAAAAPVAAWGSGPLAPSLAPGWMGEHANPSFAAPRAGDETSWWAPVERLLGSTPPGLLEGLLVATPALARLVVEAPPPQRGTPAADLQAVLLRSALLGPRPAARLVAGHLAAMPAAARRSMALLRPALMTSAAAAPPADRFAASRVLVAADVARLHERRPMVPSAPALRIDRRVAWERRLLDDQVELRHPGGTVTRHAHQLLTFDPSGDGRIVEVIGDLGRARHVAVFVPGTGSDLDRYAGTFARMTPFAAARDDLAVVVWQGADHPDQPFDDPLPSIRDVLEAVAHDPLGAPHRAREWPRAHVLAAGLRDAADVAGPVLARDVAGLHVALPGPTSDLTVLGHSYGGSMVGAAEVHGLVADRVVHVASAGAYVDDIGQYPASAGSTLRFSMTAYDDPIRLSQGHGMDDAGRRLRQLLPTALDPFSRGVPEVAADLLGPARQVGHGLDPDLLPGVVRLDTGVHDDGTLVRGHSGMFAPHSTAWRNLLAVMTQGRVEVLEPERWSSHLEALQIPTVRQQPGHPTVPGHPPRYVVDRSPYGDPYYRPPVLDLGGDS
jgi:hypothetical protein